MQICTGKGKSKSQLCKNHKNCTIGSCFFYKVFPHLCLAGNEAHDVPFSSKLPQNLREKASPPGKLAAQQTDRAGMEPPGPFMGAFRQNIDSSNRFALSPASRELSRGRACLLAGRGNWSKIVTSVSHICALREMRLMTYRFHRNCLKIFAERLPLRGWAFHSAHFRLVRSYDPSVCSADSSPITHIGAVATVNKTGGSSIFLYNWVSGRNRPTVCSLSSIPNLMQDSLFVPPSVSDTCLSF